MQPSATCDPNLLNVPSAYIFRLARIPQWRSFPNVYADYRWHRATSRPWRAQINTGESALGLTVFFECGSVTEATLTQPIIE